MTLINQIFKNFQWSFTQVFFNLFQEIPLVIAARIFDRPINGLDSRALNDALHGSKTGMIGCHWLYATVSQQ
jgi:hypothetical protein